MNYTQDDCELLAKLLYSECRGEPKDGQYAVATVIANRVESGKYPSNVPDVIFQKNQFAKPSEMLDIGLLKIATEVLADGYRAFPPNVLMFQRKRQGIWYGLRWWCQIGAHNFYG